MAVGLFALFIGKLPDHRLVLLTLAFGGLGHLVYGILRRHEQTWLSRTIRRPSRPGYFGKTTCCQVRLPQTQKAVTLPWWPVCVFLYVEVRSYLIPVMQYVQDGQEELLSQTFHLNVVPVSNLDTSFSASRRGSVNGEMHKPRRVASDSTVPQTSPRSVVVLLE
jgi:hypothetical protein